VPADTAITEGLTIKSWSAANFTPRTARDIESSFTVFSLAFVAAAESIGLADVVWPAALVTERTSWQEGEDYSTASFLSSAFVFVFSAVLFGSAAD